MSYVIYYSDFGLQREGKIRNVNHELNLKTLLLLSDKILIPASHILHADFSDVSLLVDKFSRFFYEDILYTQLPREYYDFGHYSYDYLANYSNKNNYSKVQKNCKHLSYYLFPERQNFRIYDSKMQVQSFYSMMNKYIENDGRISEITRHDILNRINSNSDADNPLSKLYFEKIIKDLEKKRRRNIEHLKTLSEVCYYAAGASSNHAIISANTYLDYKTLSMINDNLDDTHSSSEFYNAAYFNEVLKTLGIIENENEICKLSFEEIYYLKHQKCFRDFLDMYNQFSKSVNDISEIWKKEKKKYDRIETIKSLVFNFGLTISESALTAFYFEPNINPILYTIMIWALQTFIESTKFKPIKSFKYYTVDCILDKIGFSNDVFMKFCIKLKRSCDKLNAKEIRD